MFESNELTKLEKFDLGKNTAPSKKFKENKMFVFSLELN